MAATGSATVRGTTIGGAGANGCKARSSLVRARCISSLASSACSISRASSSSGVASTMSSSRILRT